MKRRLMQCLTGMALIAAAASAIADDGFTITRFEVEGNSLLPAADVQRLLQPMSGPHRVYGDIQHALEALENAYRKAGYTAVQVSVPEQELTSGIVRLQVTENRIGKITVTGNRYFSEKNVLAGLPPLRSGQSPNLRALSEAVQLSNDNPAKQVGVTLSSADETGTVDAEVKVDDENPLHVFATADNTGAASTGRWRTGVAIQDANLFGLDQVGTVAYTTSPDSPSGVRVNVYSVGYRIPLYRLGDSLEFLYGKSSINTPSSSPTLGGLLGFTGKGDIYGFRWNHLFARRGETTSKLIVGLDYKKIDSTCNVNGVDLSTAGPTPPVASCVPYTTVPLSLTYASQTRSIGQSIDYDLGLSRNLATGTQYTQHRRPHRSLFVPDAGQPRYRRRFHDPARRRVDHPELRQRLAVARGQLPPGHAKPAGVVGTIRPGRHVRGARLHRARGHRRQRPVRQCRALHAATRQRGQPASAGVLRLWARSQQPCRQQRHSGQPERFEHGVRRALRTRPQRQHPAGPRAGRRGRPFTHREARRPPCRCQREPGLLI
jgi:hypothetical protein